MKAIVFIVLLAFLSTASAVVSKLASTTYWGTRSLITATFTTVHSDSYSNRGNFDIDLPPLSSSKWKLKSCYIVIDYNNETNRIAHIVKSKLHKKKSNDIQNYWISGEFELDSDLPRGDFRIRCVVDAPKVEIKLEDTSMTNAAVSLSFSNSLSSVPSDVNYVLVQYYEPISEGFKIEGSGELTTAGKGLKLNFNKLNAPFDTLTLSTSGELTFAMLDQPTPLCSINSDIRVNAAINSATNDSLLLTFDPPLSSRKSYKINCDTVGVSKIIPGGIPVLTTITGTADARTYVGYGIIKMENIAVAHATAFALLLVGVVLCLM